MRERLFAHFRLLKKRKHFSRALQADWDRFGPAVFGATVLRPTSWDPEPNEINAIKGYATNKKCNGYNYGAGRDHRHFEETKKGSHARGSNDRDHLSQNQQDAGAEELYGNFIEVEYEDITSKSSLSENNHHSNLSGAVLTIIAIVALALWLII